MTTKIDLDDLERRIREDHNARMSGAQSLALIARIRGLETFARELIHDHVRDVDETAMHAYLDRGAVLP